MTTKNTILLTGACGGLGRATAHALVANGYALALHVRKKDERTDKLLNELKTINSSITIYEADLSKESEIIEMMNSVEEDHDSLYGLINNAGMAFSGMSWKQQCEDWDSIFNINTRAPWLMSKYALPLLRKNTVGRVIYVSSVVAHKPLAGTSAYAASKAAIEGLTRAQAIEFSRFGITVNCVAPGYFNAGMIDSVTADQQKEIINSTPQGRLGKASELAAHMVYLCSDSASFITGQVLHINGGLYI